LASYAPFIIILIIMYLFIFRGPKKKQKQHAQMVDSLKKNDRVRTIGGIFATVIDVRDKEVVIKIDESNNTKMRVSPGAIASVVTDDKD
jgi:preprotein translocase subunit YajC